MYCKSRAGGSAWARHMGMACRGLRQLRTPPTPVRVGGLHMEPEACRRRWHWGLCVCWAGTWRRCPSPTRRSCARLCPSCCGWGCRQCTAQQGQGAWTWQAAPAQYSSSCQACCRPLACPPAKPPPSSAASASRPPPWVPSSRSWTQWPQRQHSWQRPSAPRRRPPSPPRAAGPARPPPTAALASSGGRCGRRSLCVRSGPWRMSALCCSMPSMRRTWPW
mmetsp:Transcript_36418/g.81043  ORF Transcript_36418/g.81043 Transcript_36418/m.81043 type:complete len:220 (+) Transcript_36418:1103-1762(+)